MEKLTSKVANDSAQAEKQRILNRLLAQADEAHKQLDYAREQRMRDAASLVSAI